MLEVSEDSWMALFCDTWLHWILASSVGLSLYDLCKKASVRGNAVFPTLFISTASGWTALSVFMAASGRMEAALDVDCGEIAFLLVKSCIVALSWTATYLALKTLPITCASPIRATGPLWTLTGAVVLFSEVPGAVQAIGMALVFSGCLFFSKSTLKDSASGGGRAVALAFAGTVLGSCSALYDKHLLQGLGLAPLTVLWWFLGGMFLMYAVAAAIFRKGFEWRWSMPLTGILLAVSDACYFGAIAVPDAQISVLSLIRRSSIVFTFFIGGAIFRETDIRRKAFALAAIMAGVVLLCLAG
jgi:drug/metabolite transporter (DMT)-like permease